MHDRYPGGSNEPTSSSGSSTSFARLAVLTFLSAKVARLRPVRCLEVVAKPSVEVHTRNMRSHAFCIRRAWCSARRFNLHSQLRGKWCVAVRLGQAKLGALQYHNRVLIEG